jgi:hypothetical protein
MIFDKLFTEKNTLFNLIPGVNRRDYNEPSYYYRVL